MIEMPPINLNKLLHHLTEDEYILVQKIVRQGRLKANKPPIKYKTVEDGPIRIKKPDEVSGKAAYLWAAVAYELSPYKRDLAAPPDYRRYLTSREVANRLDAIAKLIIDNTPKQYRYGLIARGVM